MPAKRAITRDDILPMADYAKARAERRRAVTALKRDRRLAVGPDATAYFESYDTMLHQIHEMLFIERGGEAQVEDELRAYAPLVPNGRELVCTLMFEVDDPARRKAVLAGLGGVEAAVTLEFAGHAVAAVPEADVERTTAEGKASSIQFLHFPMTPARAAAFKAPGTRVVFAVGHPAYGHMAVMPEATRAALAADLD